MKNKIGVIGPLNIDLIINGSAPLDPYELKSWSGNTEITCLVAGAVGYFCQNIAKLGVEVHLASNISDDPFGELILSILNKSEISHDFISIEKGKESAIAIYILLFGSKKRPLTFRLPTHKGWSPKISEKTRNFLLDSQIIHCGGYLHFDDLWNGEIESIFREAKSKGLMTSLDPQFPLKNINGPWVNVMKSLLKSTDILFMDEQEAMGITNTSNLDAAFSELEQLRIPWVLVKQGEKGSTLLFQKKRIFQPSIPSKILIDSIGAGDSFDAGFLYGTISGLSPEESLRLAAYVASKSCEGVGGTTTFPTKNELDETIWKKN